MLAGLLQAHQGQIGPVDPDPPPPPLPGGAAEIVRFFMDVPQWIQIGGVFLGGLAAVALVVLSWRFRKEIGAWLTGIPAAFKIAAVALLLVGGTIGGLAGYQVYDFVEHDNRFCTGCHVMAEAYVAFEESAHAELGCKDCHAQPRTESARQLYLWVLDRPEEVGPHSPVADAFCTSCHIEGDAENWPQIAASLGHRVHFESDDPDLGYLMCVTCHGVSVHEFTPADATCGECHAAESEIRLGRMAAETELHCVACHDFLGEDPAFLPGAPEGMALLPDRAQCQACHAMAGLLEAAELDGDPHGAVCGACHNPHTQDAPAQAVETCMGCHEDAESVTIFHTGTHAPVLPDCMACHSAHSWSVQGTDCLSCHETVMEERVEQTFQDGGSGGSGTYAHGFAGGYVASSSASTGWEGWGSSIFAEPARPWALLATHRSEGPQAEENTRAGVDASTPSASDTLPPPPRASRPFLHREHEGVSCAECHGTAVEHGVVTVRTARDCAACHHDPGRPYECQDCHAASGLIGPWGIAAPMNLTVWDEPRSRDLPFDHQAHEGIACQDCHTGPVMLAVEITCASCHEDHHLPAADCTRCHSPAEPGVHGLEVHLTCTSSGCHAGTAGERPALTRSLCLACHADQRDHEPGLDCQNCHMIPDPPPVRGRGAVRNPGAAS